VPIIPLFLNQPVAIISLGQGPPSPVFAGGAQNPRFPTEVRRLPERKPTPPEPRPLPVLGANEPAGEVPPVTAAHALGEEAIRRALAYHERSKHHLHRYARGPGYMDWANQPDPFRTYGGAKKLELPFLADRLASSYADLYVHGAVAPRPLVLENAAILFELALGLSAWKQFRGNRWALRCNPSSGNLHPTEGYAILPTMPNVRAGVFHYVSRDHWLERRCALDDAGAAQLAVVLPPGSFLVGLSSVHWREAWKYGERAFRYCQHDAGHAIATVRYAAAALGWSARLLDDLSDGDRAALLGIDRDEDFTSVAAADREHPDGLLLISPHPEASLVGTKIPVDAIRGGTWTGQANPLSRSHVPWEIIDEAARATWKPIAASSEPASLPALPPPATTATNAAATLIRQRRSCLDLDGKTSISAATFYGILDHLLPRPGVPPWDALPWAPHIHAGLFVHRVHGLVPGLYLLERSPAVHDRMRAALRDTFLWKPVAGCPEHLRLFCLAEADLREAARITSCHQEIASDGAFSLGMIADFGDAIRARGAWWYRRLFWEAGVFGQVLYLEAEAAGVRGTGIGCYFDDTFHQLLGLTGDQFQDLYHFTVGGPVEDTRLLTLPPYAHRQRR
jgi:SagB-type dehydrogenase family enzyme